MVFVFDFWEIFLFHCLGFLRYLYLTKIKTMINTLRPCLFCCCLLLAFVSSSLFGQGWEQFTSHYPGSNSGKYKMCYALDSGVVVLGTTSNDTGTVSTRSAWVRKFDQSGTLLWEKFYNSSFVINNLFSSFSTFSLP